MGKKLKMRVHPHMEIYSHEQHTRVNLFIKNSYFFFTKKHLPCLVFFRDGIGYLWWVEFDVVVAAV